MKKKVKSKISHYDFFKKNHKGTILVENILFIILNLVFLSILILFLYTKMGDAAAREEMYAKKIALIIDSAKPGMSISLNMKDAVDQAKKEDYLNKKIVMINGNTVTVKLREKGGYSYSFFNDVDFDILYFYPTSDMFKFEVIKKEK
ncbi:MAG: hypothetical protein PVJ67_05330 [Candidatus Pacearchaeota archaeon]